MQPDIICRLEEQNEKVPCVMYRVRVTIVQDDVNPGNENPQVERKASTQEHILECLQDALDSLFATNFLLSEPLKMPYGTNVPICVQLLLAGFA